MDHHGDVETLCQIDKLLVERTDDSTIKLKTDQGSDLGSEIFSHPEKINTALRSLKGPPHYFKANV